MCILWRAIRCPAAVAMLALLAYHAMTAPAAPATGAANAGAPVPTSEPMPVRANFPNLLQSYGTKYGLYFTVERDEVDSHNRMTDASGKIKYSPLQSRTILVPATVRDADSFLDALRQALPQADVFKDDAVPAITHIREKSLAQRPGYLLDQKVDLLFKGTAAEFLAEVGRQSDWTFEMDAYAIPNSPTFTGKSIPSEVFIKGGTFRTVLSAGLPRWNNPVLWTSYAIEKEGRLVTMFRVGLSSPPPATTGAQTRPPPASALPAHAPAEIQAAMAQRQAARQAIDRTTALIVGRPDSPLTPSDANLIAPSDNFITVCVPLRNIPASTMLQDLLPLFAPQAVTGILNNPNSLVISDAATRVRQYLQIIKCLDDAAGVQRAAAVARGADPHGLQWIEGPGITLPGPPPVPTTKRKGAADRALAPVYDNPPADRLQNSDTLITVIVRLQHAPAAPLAAAIEPLLTPAGAVASSTTAHCLILTDTGTHVKRLLEIINKMDTQPPQPPVPPTPATTP